MRKWLRLSTCLPLLFAGFAGAMLFRTAQSVQTAEQELATLRQSIAKEEKTIRVLRAEWDYLNNPARLETLTLKYLGLGAPDPGNILPDLSVFSPPANLALPQRKPAFAAPSSASSSPPSPVRAPAAVQPAAYTPAAAPPSLPSLPPSVPSSPNRPAAAYSPQASSPQPPVAPFRKLLDETTRRPAKRGEG